MQKIETKLNNFTAYLEANQTIHPELHLINKSFLSLSERSLKREQKLIKEDNGIDIKDDELAIFNISGLSFCWSYTNENNQFIYGGYLFNGFFEALAQESDFWDVYNSINRHQPDEAELQLLKKLNWFEKQAWGDDGKFGCFLREPGNFPPKIYFYDNGAIFPMPLRLDEYVDAMIASCAVRGWQYFYINLPDKFPELPKVNKNIVLQDVEFIVEMLPKLFPDQDFRYHQERLKYIERKLR